MFTDHLRDRDYDVTKPRLAVYKHNWKIHQNTVYWCNLRVAQSKGLQIYQTRSNAIILHNTSHAMCVENVVVRTVRRRIVQQSVSVSYCTTKNCTEAELEL